MEQSKITIFGSKCLVLGYGRCGKILAHMLKGIGARVTATFRNQKDAAFIKAYGYTAKELINLEEYIHEFDFVFNTVPAQIITREILERSNKKTIIIDLAQAPGGVDFKSAKEMDIKAMFCPGLPGIVAPETAAGIIKDTIIDIIYS